MKSVRGWRSGLSGTGSAVAWLLLASLWGCSSPGSTASRADLEPIGAVAEERHREGLELLWRGQDETALMRFDEAVEASPLFVEAHRRRQNLRLAEHDREALLGEYRALLEAHPDSAAAHYLFGRLHHRVEDRLARFEAAHRADPRMPWGLYGLAWVREARGDSAGALELLGEVLARNPRHSLALRLRGDILLRRGRLDEAEIPLRRLAALEPDSPEALSPLASLLAAQRRELEELDVLRRLLEIRAGDGATLGRLERIARDRVRDDAGYLAWRILEDEAARRPEDGALHARLAMVREERGLLDGAVEAGLRALDLGRRDREFVLGFRGFRRAPFGRAFAAWLESSGVSRSPRIEALGRAIAAWEAPGGERGRKASDLVEAMAAAGWVDEALTFAEERHGAFGEDPARRAVIEELLRHRRVVAEIALFAEQERLRPEAERADESLASFLSRIATRVERGAGVVLEPDPVEGFALLGEVLDLTAERPRGLNAYLRRFNRVLVAGRWADEPPQLLLATLGAPPRRERPAGWPDAFGYVEIQVENVLVSPPENRELGRAFWRSYVVNLDRIMPSKRQRDGLAGLAPEVRTRLLASRGLPAAGRAERLSTSEPLDASTALLLRALELHGEIPLVEHVRTHEIGHVLDAARRLPVLGAPLRNALLALEAGFSSERIGAILEETAQLHALRHGPSPHLVLSDILDFLPADEPEGYHARGYASLLDRFLLELDGRLDRLPHIRRDRVLLHQLHHLGEAEIREIAFAIAN